LENTLEKDLDDALNVKHPLSVKEPPAKISSMKKWRSLKEK
jgi:hypothetical protein